MDDNETGTPEETTAPAETPPQAAQTPPAPSSPQTSFGTGRMIAVVGGLVLIVGVMLPWMETPLGPVKGMETDDGKIIFIAGLIAVATLFIKNVPIAVPLVLGLLASALGIYDFVDIQNTIAETEAQLKGNPFAALAKFEMGNGLYLTIVGGIALVIGSSIVYSKKD